MSPASGSAAAVTAEMSAGIAATDAVDTTARSAQPDSGGCPTTRVPTDGPLPSRAAARTVPAMSLPGRQPARGWSSRNVSPG